MNPRPSMPAFSVLALVLCLTSTITAQEPVTFQVSPSAIPAGRSRLVRITSDPKTNLSKFEVEKPSEDSGVVFDQPQFADGDKTIVLKISVDDDADEQILPITIVKKEGGAVTK